MGEIATLVSNRKFKSMAEVRQINKAIGHHFFDRETMRFFNYRIESGLYGGLFFITSECRDNQPRRYTIRAVLNDGSIITMGKPHHYKALESARDAARSHAEYAAGKT